MAKNELKIQRLKIVEFFRTWCAYLLFRYELITCTCMFEPWEKIFINSLILTILCLVTYSSWVELHEFGLAGKRCCSFNVEFILQLLKYVSYYIGLQRETIVVDIARAERKDITVSLFELGMPKLQENL